MFFDLARKFMGINFHGHGGVVGRIIVRFVKLVIVNYFSWIRGYPKIHKNLYTLKISTCMVYTYI